MPGGRSYHDTIGMMRGLVGRLPEEVSLAPARQTSPEVAAAAARLMQLTDEQLLATLDDDVVRAALLSDVRSVAASAVSQAEGATDAT